jgi:hypothetical protein
VFKSPESESKCVSSVDTIESHGETMLRLLPIRLTHRASTEKSDQEDTSYQSRDDKSVRGNVRSSSAANLQCC